MVRSSVIATAALCLLALLGGGSANAAPAPETGSWTPHPVAGFSGEMEADQPKMVGSATGALTAAWFGSLPEPFMLGGNVIVTSYDGASWSCPIALHGTTPPLNGVPPALDVGADGTVAVAGDGWMSDTSGTAPEQDVVVFVRGPRQTSFTSAGTGQGFPVRDDVVIATSSVRTVAVWVSGDNVVGAEVLPGATRATPVVLATGESLAFAKVRMDARGNAAVVYRSGAGINAVQQNWLIWPAAGTPSSSQAFAVTAPDDFVEPKAFSVSAGGRMVIAMYDGASGDKTNEIAVFVGATTTGFVTRSTLLSGDPLPATDFGTAVDDEGHATVAFRMDDVGSSEAKAWIYGIDPVTGKSTSSGSFTESGDTGIAIFKVLQQGATGFVSWTDSNFNALGPGGVVSYTGGVVTQEMRTSESDWIGLASGPRGPAAYWPRQSLPDDWSGTFTTTLPHKPLKAKLTNTKVTVSKRSGAITVTGKVTPAPAAKACAGAPVAVQVVNPDPYQPSSAMTTLVVAADGGYTWRERKSELKGCTSARVSTYLQTPDGPKPVVTTKKVRCSP